jgi:hypothetical protein
MLVAYRHAKRVSMPMGYIRFWGGYTQPRLLLIRESFGPVLKPLRYFELLVDTDKVRSYSVSMQSPWKCDSIA